jgi:hypothetical protein
MKPTCIASSFATEAASELAGSGGTNPGGKYVAVSAAGFTSAVYGAIVMPWAKLVGRIAQAYGK